MSKRKVLAAGIKYPINTWRIVRGDLVEVITGKWKGQRGVVQKVQRKKNRLVVEGVNLIKKRMKGNKEQKGGVYTIESGIHYSNCQLVDPSDDRPCRAAFKYLEDGKKVRVSKRTGAVIPRPEILTQQVKHDPGPLDTAPESALKVTLQDVIGPSTTDIARESAQESTPAQ